MAAFNTQPVFTGNIFDGPTEIYVEGGFIGATVGGVELQHSQELGEQIADQSPLLLGSYIKQSRGMLKFELEDLSLSNMQLIFANPGAAVGGGNKSLMRTKQVQFRGHGPNDTTRTVTIWKGRFRGNTTGKHVLGESVAYSVELHFEADQSQPDGQQYFSIIDA
jgi:hypothetical protein